MMDRDKSQTYCHILRYTLNFEGAIKEHFLTRILYRDTGEEIIF